jgi:hypothetical protein
VIKIYILRITSISRELKIGFFRFICLDVYSELDIIGAKLGQDATSSSLCKFAKIPIARIHLTQKAVDIA